ncbi:MAG: c-type cytochrome biogenesis protein CcmI [Burkholderiales bacterium]|nr:c-type cytochrome biogenesis protein CcmI [Burkholderiales bacterium]
MNPAIALVLLMLAMLAAVLWWLLRVLLRGPRAPQVVSGLAESESANVDALRSELAEARRDRQLGLLSDTALAEAEREIEARVLAESTGVDAGTAAPRSSSAAVRPSRRPAIALGVLLPLLSLGAYFLVGSPAAVIPDVVRPQPTAAKSAEAEQQMEAIFRQAEERLAKQPDDARGWALLARARASVAQFDKALVAYEKAAALTPQDADLWADFADAAAGQAEGKMAGKPLELINRALALDARNAKALLLRGTWEIQNNQLAAAVKTFTLAKSVVEPNSGFAQIADNALADLASRGASGATAAPSASGVATAPSSAANAAASPAAAATPIATVRIALPDAARRAATAKSAVFLIVRNGTGADRAPPLAVRKLTLGELERPVVLTTADAMIGGSGLQPGAAATLQARLSITGQPTPQRGDWQSNKLTITLPAGEQRLSLDQAVE